MHETPSLKLLAFKALERLERNRVRNKYETKGLMGVSRAIQGETKNKTWVKPFSLYPSSVLEDYEERMAISEYDGHQTPLQAQRIAYLDAFMAVLSTLPCEEEEGYYDEDWLTRRIKATQHWLDGEGLQQPK